jgi:leader peptidase (prepilin peptidase)/N-methyltransferase
MPLEELLTFWTDNRPFLGAFVFFIGATVGSFLNVVALRLPRMMQRDWHTQCCDFLDLEHEPEQTTFNLAFPPSHCPECNHAIRWWENIPVVSYLLLKGNCSSCKTRISVRYPLVELLTAVLTLLVFLQLDLTIQTVFAILFTWILIALAIIDFDEKLLPDSITLPLLWSGLAINFFGFFTSLESAVLGAMAGYLSLWSIFWLFKLLTGKEGMGFGDFKLFAALGAWMGWQALPMIILVASCCGSIIGIFMIVLKNHGRDTAIPFGPFLAMAGWLSLVYGTGLADLLHGLTQALAS